MSVRFNVTLSDDLNEALEAAAEQSESNKADVLRKAMTLYLAALDGKRRGLKLGLIEADTQKVQTEIVGL